MLSTAHAGTQLVAAVHYLAGQHQHLSSQYRPLGLLCSTVCLCHSDQWEPVHRLPTVWPSQQCPSENADPPSRAGADVHRAVIPSSREVTSHMTAASCCVLNLLLLQVAEEASNRRVMQHVSNMFTLIFLAIM